MTPTRLQDDEHHALCDCEAEDGDFDVAGAEARSMWTKMMRTPSTLSAAASTSSAEVGEAYARHHVHCGTAPPHRLRPPAAVEWRFC